MTTIRECILQLLDVAYEQTSDEIIQHVQATFEKESIMRAGDIAPVIRKMILERWLYYAPDSMNLRRRTQAQWDALQAANNPNQGSLL
jgi:hypothetical protein